MTTTGWPLLVLTTLLPSGCTAVAYTVPNDLEFEVKSTQVFGFWNPAFRSSALSKHAYNTVIIDTQRFQPFTKKTYPGSIMSDAAPKSMALTAATGAASHALSMGQATIFSTPGVFGSVKNPFRSISWAKLCCVSSAGI